MGKAVFLLHGWLSDCNDFQSLLPFLEKRYEHLEKVTYPGHGHNDSYRNFIASETIEYVETAFRNLSGTYEIDVIGYSMGGALAAYLASKYQVRRLILLAPGNKYFNYRLPFSKINYFLKTIYAFQKALFKRDSEYKNELKHKLKFVFRDDFESIKVLKERFMRGYIRHAYRNYKKLITYVNENTAEIKCPCFLAWGRLDQLIPIKSIRFISDLCTNTCKVIKIYDYMSHFLLLSPDCDELVQDIIAFLEAGDIS